MPDARADPDLETCCLQNALQRTVSYLLRSAADRPPLRIWVCLPAPKSVIRQYLEHLCRDFLRSCTVCRTRATSRSIGTIYLRDRDGLVALAEGAGRVSKGG